MASKKKTYSTKQVIENLELWKSLTKEEQAYLESNIEFISYKKNSIIYSDGEEPTKLLGVLSGFVKINKEGVGVRSQIVRIIKPNELFGYRAMFAVVLFTHFSCFVCVKYIKPTFVINILSKKFIFL